MFKKEKIVKNKKEHILLLGLGGIGSYLAKRLLHEDYDVTVIEPLAELIRAADESMDARFIQGSALDVKCWHEADAKDMDYMIAVTDNDAVNMLSAMIAERFGIRQKIARVRSPHLGHPDSILPGKDLHIDFFIHPEELAAKEIARIIKRTAGNEIIDIALGQMQVMGARISPTSPFANKNLIEISKKYNEFPFRVVAISRGIRTIIPSGEHIILPQDHILIMADKEDLPKLMELTGMRKEQRQKILILGGGLVGIKTAELLSGKDVAVSLLEKDAQRAQELSALNLPRIEVLSGDGSDKSVLEEVGLLNMDTFIAATGENETNIMSCVLAKHLTAEQNESNDSTEMHRMKTVCLVNKEEYLVLASTSGSDIVLNKKILAGNEILTFIRSSEVLSIDHMHGFDAEVVDIVAAPNAKITKKPLAKQTQAFAGQIIIGSVFRGGQWSTAVGDTHILEGDRAIVICNSMHLKKVRKLFS